MLEGRPWRASELRLKSYEDLQKLWYVLLKERNMLLSERERLGRETARKANVPQRIGKVLLPLPLSIVIYRDLSIYLSIYLS